MGWGILSLALVAALVLLLLSAGIEDARRREIANWKNAAIALMAPAWWYLQGYGWADAGIQLGQAQVGAENARQWAQQDKHGDNSASDPARADLGDTAISPVSSGSLSTSPGLKGGRGLVDVFA